MSISSIQNSALLLIEFQQEWLSQQGKLHHLFTDKDQFLSSIENAKIALAASRQTSIHIIHSGLCYSADYKELGSSQHGLRNAIAFHQTFSSLSNGSQFSPPFTPLENEFAILGRTGASVFAGSNLDSYCRNNHITTLYLMGYALHVCVESTLRAAHDLGYETILIEDASAAFNQQQKEYVLRDVVHHFGNSIKTKDFITILNKNNQYE